MKARAILGRQRWFASVGWIALTTSLISAPLVGADRSRALLPTEALAAFRLEAGLRIELVTAEPQVVAPVAVAFDDERRLFVGEGRGYPEPAEGAPAVTEGQVVLLEDRDGDGRCERRTVFASGLTFPNGIAVWRGGVLARSNTIDMPHLPITGCDTPAATTANSSGHFPSQPPVIVSGAAAQVCRATTLCCARFTSTSFRQGTR
ncbi:MAG: hypothetical protein Q8N18_25375 [Opitutaceae bacterium]|nr:hypothetical protein [Opitutaceae bacterium]